MTLKDTVAALRSDIGANSYRKIAAWKEKNPGGKAVGCYPVYTPVEIVRAAGMLPALIAGAGGGIDIDQAREHLQAFICSIGHSTLELDLDGYLDEIDCMVFPSICEISRGLRGVWARLNPGLPVIYIHFPQNLESA